MLVAEQGRQCRGLLSELQVGMEASFSLQRHLTMSLSWNRQVQIFLHTLMIISSFCTHHRCKQYINKRRALPHLVLPLLQGHRWEESGGKD